MAGSGYGASPRSSRQRGATLAGLVLRPAAFFRTMPRGALRAGLFALCCLLVSAALAELTALAGLGGSGEWRGLRWALEITAIAGALGLGIILAVAVMVHLLVLWLAGRDRGGFGTTFGIACYASVVELASWTPLIGWVVELYFFYLLMVGVREAHRTSGDRALAISLVPLLVVFLVLVAISLAGIRGVV